MVRETISVAIAEEKFEKAKTEQCGSKPTTECSNIIVAVIAVTRNTTINSRNVQVAKKK